MTLKEILKLVLGWRLLTVLIAIPAMFLMVPNLRYTPLTDKPSLPNIFSMWANFDGINYLDIAELGYGLQNKTEMDYAFFPVYPWLINKFSFVGGYLASGLVLSHLSLILAIYFLYKLILLDHKKGTALNTIYLLLFFPTAFFLGSVYADSFFLLLVVLVFYAARKGNFFMACLIAAIASATKITGIFLWPAIAYEYWLSSGLDIKKAMRPTALWLTLPPIGLISFLRFQWLKTGDAFFFLSYQENFSGRTIEKLVLLHQIFFRYAKMVIFTDHMDPLFFTVMLELLTATGVLLILIFAFKSMRRSYWLFSLLSFLLPTLTGTFTGIPRYTLALFPVFIWLSLWMDRQHPYIKIFYCTVTVAMSILAIIFFTRGYFIA